MPATFYLVFRLIEVGLDYIVFCSTKPISYQGARPALINSEMNTWNMSPKALERTLRDAHAKEKLRKAAMKTKFYGQSATWTNSWKFMIDMITRYGITRWHL